MTKSEILKCARSLPAAERAELAMELWDPVDLRDAPLSEEMKRELDRRIVADDADNSPGEDWSLLREELLRGEI